LSALDMQAEAAHDNYTDDPAAAFLAALDPNATAFTFQTFDDNKERAAAHKKAHEGKADPELTRVINGSLAQVRGTLQRLNDRGCGIFVTVNETDLEGRKTENIKRMRALFLDMDGAPIEPVLAAGPHIVVESSPGHFHPYFLVHDVELDQFTPAQEVLIKRFGGDPAAKDRSRVMRLPGFVHRKGEPFLSRIVAINDLPPYRLADLVPPAQQEPPPEEPRPNGAYGHRPNFDFGRDFFRQVNDLALVRADRWVPAAFPGAYKNGSGQWRVPPHALNRDCEEDLSISPNGIVDFGIHDMGDARGGKRTAIDLVIEYARLHEDATDAALWLCEQMGVDPASLGWRRSARPSGGAEQQNADDDDGDGLNAPPPPAEPPRPLTRELPPAEPFPADALGSVLGNAAQAILDRVQVPMAIGAQSVLAAAALAVQGHADIELPIGRGSRRPVGDYFVTVAASGDRKSEADRQALWPIEKHEAVLRAKHGIALPAYINRKLAWDKAREVATRDGKGNVNAIRQALDALGPAPRPPLEPMLTAPEPTFEGLCRLFMMGWPSLGIFSTEGGQFIGGHGMSEDNRIKTASGLSDLWDGKPIPRVRVNDGATILPGRRLSVHLMAQPGVASGLFADERLADQGLLSRLLVAAPDSIVGSRIWHEEQPETDQAISRYGARLLDILEAPPPLREGTTNELEPRAIPLSADARALWIKFVNHIEHEIAPGGALEPIRGLANKLGEHAARLAAVLALIEDINAGEIRAAEIEAGIVLAEYYASEALRLHGASRVSAELILAQRLLTWLLTSWSEPAVSLPDIYQRSLNVIGDKATAAKVVATLEDHGWLVRIYKGATIAGQQRRDAWRIVRG
jgi:hypothetical protein